MPDATPSVALVSKAIGDGRFSKQEAEKLRKRLEHFLADVDNDESPAAYFDQCDNEMSLL